uniref:Vav guanine nucleotide exchange factor 3 n=1 Tax=Coturnix japonica TaxID=93934 RepID=A0A8C2UDI0_COTJA
MEPWKQCGQWLISCKVLPPNHRVTWDTAQVFDLAQTLRDGVLLCQLLNNLRSHSINLKEINLRPQMSQFLCLKNIRTFLSACCEIFGMKKSELFEAFDLFDVRDFGKVRIFYETGIDEDEELYDCVYGEDEGGEVYEDLMKDEAAQQPKHTENDVRSCCLAEIKQTEEKYTETLESIEKFFMVPLKRFLSASEFETVFINIPVSNCLFNKEANNGKFTLRDLLVVPMQRVLKYHLLLQELVKHTTDPMEKANLRLALDAMKDLAQYVNEVKRDNETLREIRQFQLSIENLNHSLLQYGRPQGDGEIRITTLDKRARHIFLFDLAVIVCKRRGDNYEMKEIIDLQKYKITNNPTTDKENKKWSYGFYLIHIQGQNGLEVYCKTKDLKKKWLEQFQMALSNIRPDYADTSFHEFKMHTFSRVTSCKVCQMLLRGTFYQGYLCSKCGAGAHKECLGRLDNCGRANSGGLPRMQVIRNYKGIPQPAPQDGPPLHIQIGDTIELITGDAHSLFWQVLYCLQNDRIPLVSDNKFIFRNLSYYYKHHSLKEGFRSLDTTLQFPYKESENSVGQRAPSLFCGFSFVTPPDFSFVPPSSTPFWSVLSPKVIGIAIARYDFCARDMRELSLLKGDVVKIYTKMSANGWWRGEVNGRVGWFPSTYVEEDE